MELVPLNRADKARCHPCQHVLYIWGNLRTFWLKEILLLPNTDWQQKCFMASFFSLNDCNSFCNLCKGSGQKGAGDWLSLSSRHITKGTVQWGMRREPQGKGDKGTEGKSTGLRDTFPTQACLWESDECGSFLIWLSVRKVWLSVHVLQHESSPGQQAVTITKSLFLDWNQLPVQFKDLTQGVSSMQYFWRRISAVCRVACQEQNAAWGRRQHLSYTSLI